MLLVFDFRAVGFTICQANGAQWLHVGTDRECVLNVYSKHWITSLHFGSQLLLLNLLTGRIQARLRQL